METRKAIVKPGKNGLSILTARTLFFGGIVNLSLIEIESIFIPIGSLLAENYWSGYFAVILKFKINFR
ncbi:hypothetical protein VZ94_05505 [Methylocucumis oryzae]|uniref:Uncharacterized protein n=1 Tax=Methylocucumis oryzae TaxID=1632867 RepID=A0A0F3IKU2_9GAMM|nr:hypothetical protein VZ94_05505 [Methylocucumis oryzae]